MARTTAPKDFLMPAINRAQRGFENGRLMQAPNLRNLTPAPIDDSGGYDYPMLADDTPVSAPIRPRSPRGASFPMLSGGSNVTGSYPMLRGNSTPAPNVSGTFPMRSANVPMTPSMINANNAATSADYLEALPLPSSAEALARRKALIGNKRRTSASLSPGMVAEPTPAPVTASPSLRDKAYAFNAVGRATNDPELAGELSGLTPNAATPSAPGAGTPPSLPRESETIPREVAAGKERKRRFPITAQHAKAMFDAISQSGVDVEGFNPGPIFARLMREYGLSGTQADSLVKSFTELAQRPDTGMKYLQPEKRKQIESSPDSLGAAEAANPFKPGNVLPGHNPIGTGTERRPGPDGVVRERRADGFWYPVSQME